MSISYSPSFIYEKNRVAHGVTESLVQEKLEQMNQAIARVDQKMSDGEYGFINILKNTEMLKQMATEFQAIRWAKTLVVVGIGGSDLGARAIQQALEIDRSPLDVLFHGDSTDPVQLSRLLQQVDLEETVFCIISKSGETIETISQYVLFKTFLKNVSDEWAHHFMFITDKAKGILREEADQHGIPTLIIPDDVGGRFSVQTTVGLFPALGMGVEVAALIEGAQSAIMDHKDIAQQIARDQFLLYESGVPVSILMPYSVQLEEFARWYRQLYAESLGKDGKGILPIQARGPADQHSQAQFYTEGNMLHSLLFIRIEKRADDFIMEGVDIPALQYLNGHSLHEIVNVEQEATALALKKLGRPSATLSLDVLDANHLGRLFLIFEMAVVYLAEMLGVDAFNQPGVEEGKQMMYALLGREGWEEKRQEIEELRKE